MNKRTAAIIFLFTLTVFQAYAQSTCSALGQNPATAFPVCGTASFTQNTVAICGNRPVPGIGCTVTLTDKNPYWYKFTCFEAGKLGFQITPNDLGDDYDWQIFDITGRDPNDVYTTASLIVSSNWSGESGITGASAAGRSPHVCEGPGKALFSTMPDLIKGHEYIMLVSHFTNSQSGYKLSFGGSGSTASITDVKPPAIEGVAVKCDGTQLTVTLNKKMRCNSLAADGSDFNLSTTLARVQAAVSSTCTGGFDMETINLTLNNPLPPGTYKLNGKIGSDANSLVDYCGNAIGTQEISFTVNSIQPTPMDSLVPVICAPNELKLIFRSPIRCNSIATNGSDFVISGPAAIRISGATGACDAAGLTKSVTIRLQSPVAIGGNYQLRLVNGSDLNTLIDECGQSTPAGASLGFSVKDTVSAAFSYNVLMGCTIDTISFSHDGRNGVSSWKWILDDGKSSNLQNPDAYYTKFGEKRISLVVSNGFCSDTSNQGVILDNELKAKFKFPEIVCPKEAASFVDSSRGKITSWNWQFGNGITSASQQPSPQQYDIPALTRELKYNVSLTVGNAAGCFHTATVTIKAVSSCYIAVPTAFTPNRDGVNDYLYPLNAFKATDLVFKVFNRYGQVVFETTDWNQRWDGTLNGKAQAAGIFVWTLSYKESDTGKKVTLKGSSALVR
jgi:gliding motility-associated-like protein